MPYRGQSKIKQPDVGLNEKYARWNDIAIGDVFRFPKRKSKAFKVTDKEYSITGVKRKEIPYSNPVIIIKI